MIIFIAKALLRLETTASDALKSRLTELAVVAVLATAAIKSPALFVTVIFVPYIVATIELIQRNLYCSSVAS